jgi:hypothetical protein
MLNPSFCRLMAGVSVLICALQANANVFSKTDFDPGTWSVYTPFEAQPAEFGTSLSVASDRFGTMDGDIMIQLFTMEVPSDDFTALYAPIFFDGFTYDPSTQGAIETLSGSVRTLPVAVQPPHGGYGVMRLFLEQGGKLFVLSALSPNFPTNYPSFEGFNVYGPEAIRTASSVVASDFVEVIPGVGFSYDSVPDFGGGPINFGFGYSMTSTGIAGYGQTLLAAGFDDVNVRLTVVPEPATAALLLLGLPTLWHRRRAGR